MDKILTIIIPTYNMEKYLQHCLDSLIVEGMESVEVLIINDGSKDASSEIGHEYQNKYPETFRVIDKENGNYGSCINRGLKEARGQYIRVLDADDSYEKDGLEELIKTLKFIDVDLVITDFQVVDENDKVTRRRIFSSNCPDAPKRQIFDFPSFISNIPSNFLGAMHGYTYRTQMLRDMGYRQTEGISYTDQEWATIPVSRVKTCYYLPVYIYRYLVGREGQTMQTLSEKSINQSMVVLFNLIDFYENGTYDHATLDKYYKSYIAMDIESDYFQGLVQGIFPIDKIVYLDNKLKEHPDLYSYSNTLDRYGIDYIRQWRENNRSLSPLIKIMLSFAQWLHDVKYNLKYRRSII